MASGATDTTKIGRGKSPAQNPPEMGEGDWFAWAWFWENCLAFDQVYGLTSRALEGLALSGPQLSLFKRKLREIYGYAVRMEMARLERERNKWRTKT